MFSAALLLLLAAGCVKCEQLTQPASVTVQPGQRLTITCQVSYSVSGYYTAWIRQPAGKGLEWIGSARIGYTTHYKDSLKNKFSIALASSSNTVTLNGQNVQPEDTAVYYCARRGVAGEYFDYWGKGTMVTVTTDTPSKPTAFPLMQCGSGTGQTVTLGCLTTGFNPSSLTYTWTKNGAALNDFIQYTPVQKDNLYTGVSQIQVSRQDWEAVPPNTIRCAVTHSEGNAQCDFKPIRVPYQLPTLNVLASSHEENPASFSCFAKDFSPKDYQITWQKNDAEIPNKIYEVQTPVAEKVDENGDTLYSVASFLKVPSSEWTPGTRYTCLFQGKGERNIPTFKNSSVTHEGCPTCDQVVVDIKISGPTIEDMFLHGKGTITCHVNASKPSLGRIWWEDQHGNEMADASITPPDGSKGPVNLPLEITYEEWSKGIERNCIVEHTEWVEPKKKRYERNIEFLIETNVQWIRAKEAEEDNMGYTAVTFILLFLITLLFTIGTTAVKVK